jgi:hypothetical protein
MRGVPNNPVKCCRCGRMNGCASDQRCHSCRILSREPARRKFVWTSGLDEILRRAYKNANTRKELSTNLSNIQRGSGFTRNVILSRAVQLGLSFSTRRPWTEQEVETLEARSGQATLKALAVRLNRTHSSVKAKLKELGLSGRLSEGYTQDDLRQLLGASTRSIKHWLACGWLRMVQGRIPEASVLKFLRLHSEQYHLGRVNQAWFKGLLFPAFNGNAHRRADIDQARVARAAEPHHGRVQQPYGISELESNLDGA